MKKLFVSLAIAASLVGCTSIETAQVGSEEVASNGEAIAVVQATSIGFTAILHLIDIVQSDLDQVVNKLLVSEAKAMGASKVDLLTTGTTPRHGIFSLTGLLIGFPVSQATGVAVK